MSYLNRAQDPGRRTTTIAAVMIVHAALGFALVNGLAYQALEKVREYRPTFDFNDPPPPPPPDPVDKVLPDPPKAQDFISPKPPLELPTNNRVEPKPFDPVAPVDPVVPLRPTPGMLEKPLPQPSFAPKRAAPRNDISRWVMTEDYPSRPLREGAEGVAGFRVVVGSDGRVDACEITSSSGNALLDEATCKFVTRRARFDPATDGNGQKVVGSYSSTVRWQIPE